MVLCAVLVFTGCDSGNDTQDPGDIATDGPPVSLDSVDQSSQDTAAPETEELVQADVDVGEQTPSRADFEW